MTERIFWEKGMSDGGSFSTGLKKENKNKNKKGMVQKKGEGGGLASELTGSVRGIIQNHCASRL
jgi:hypothetical protein